ncbi:MAG: hypothetical protein P8X88_06585, partial [Gammaproteobacteria bacterium]
MDSLDIYSIDSLPGLITLVVKSMVVIPEIALLIAASTILMISLFSGQKSEIFTFVLSLASLVTVLFLIMQGIKDPDVLLFGEMYVNDELAKF